MRYSFRLVATTLFICILFSVYKVREFREQELLDKDALLAKLASKERELDLTAQELKTIRSTHKDLNQKIKDGQQSLEDKTSEYQIKIGELDDLVDQKFVSVNKIYKKWTFIKDQPRYKKVTYVKKNVDIHENDLIVLSVIGHSESYGPRRTFTDFLQLVESLDYDWNTASLGLLVGSQEEYDNILSQLDKLESESSFSKIVVINSLYIEQSSSIDRESRHDANLQKERRRNISKSRNFLVTNAISDESFTLFLDSDMFKIPKDMVKVFMETKKDVIVPRIAKGTTIENYDFNSWRGRRVKPNAEEEKKMDTDPKYYFVPRPDGADHMHDIMHKKKEYGHNGEESFIVELDSVGGAILWLKSEIFKQGVMFPSYYIIGTKWEREGYDGIETEGLCYQAKIIGYKCWGMPNYVAYHVEEAVS